MKGDHVIDKLVPLPAENRLMRLIEEIPPERIPKMIAACEQMKATLMARLMTLAPAAPVTEDRLLTIDEAAQKLSRPVGWLYRNSSRLPFTVRTSPRRVRFSLAGIEKYIRSRQGGKG